MHRPTIVRLSIFLATVVAAWGVLSLGSAEAEPVLVVGMPASQTFTAGRDQRPLLTKLRRTRLNRPKGIRSSRSKRQILRSNQRSWLRSTPYLMKSKYLWWLTR